MANYYYLGTALPNLSFDAPPEISFRELIVLLKDNLNPADYQKTKVLRQFFDILNLRSLWLGESLDPFGEMTLWELQEATVSTSGFPDYVYDFLHVYPNKEDRILHFPSLLVNFFQSTSQLKDKFLYSYMKFERELRLILTALRAKRLGRDLSIEFQYEDPQEELIARLLVFKDSEVDELPESYRDLKSRFDEFFNDPFHLQESIEAYRFNMIDRLVDMPDIFSSERILAYLAQYIIVQRWFELNKAKGTLMIENLVKKMKLPGADQ